MRIARLTSLVMLLVFGFAAVSIRLDGQALTAITSSPSQPSSMSDEQAGYAPNEVVIGWDGQSEEALQELVESWNGVIVEQLPQIHAFLVRVRESRVSTTVFEAEAYAGLEYVEPNYHVNAALTPNDPQWVLQWALPKVRADLAWDVELGRRSLTVAVIDTGIDYTHPDLAANYVPGGYDWVNHDNDPMDDSITGHGTGVAGVIGAVTNNGVGIAGVAQVGIMAEKALNKFNTGTVFNVAEAVVDAADKGARITNNSFGTYDYSAVLFSAYRYAYEVRGVLNVAAAGNDNRQDPFYPAAFTEFVISVAGTDENDARWDQSNFGDWIELSAPAVHIMSTVPGDSGKYDYFTGTSMASGFVAGGAALTWSHCRCMSAIQIRQRLQETAVDLGAPGRDPYFGYGRIDLFAALKMPCDTCPVGGRILEPVWSELLMFRIEIALATMGLVGIAFMFGRARCSSSRKAPQRD